MIRLLPIFLLLAACSVQVQPLPTVHPQAIETLAPDERLATAESQSTRALATAFVPTPTPDRWNFLILGIDKAYWRDTDPKRPHTDFMMVEQALGLPLVGAAAMRMDDFITLVDDQGGLTIGGTHYNGLELLTWTRFDLFERPGYDAQSKHFEVLEALADKFRELVLQNMGLVLNTIDEYSELVETDIDRLSVLGFLFNQGLPLLQGKYSVERVRLEDALCYEDIPFENPGTTKGLLVCDGINLHEWVQEALQ